MQTQPRFCLCFTKIKVKLFLKYQKVIFAVISMCDGLLLTLKIITFLAVS